jgi:hypothetical protein
MVDENNLAVLEHMDNMIWQNTIDMALENKDTFFMLLSEYDKLDQLAGKKLPLAGMLLSAAMSKFATEAVRRGIIPAQNTEGFDDLKRIIQENS